MVKKSVIGTQRVANALRTQNGPQTQFPHWRGQIGIRRGGRLLQETVKPFLSHSGEAEEETGRMDLGEIVGSRSK